jgi:hypothetical protein
VAASLAQPDDIVEGAAIGGTVDEFKVDDSLTSRPNDAGNAHRKRCFNPRKLVLLTAILLARLMPSTTT